MTTAMDQERFNDKIVTILERNQELLRKIADNQRAIVNQMELLKRLIDAKGYGD